jgi:methionyl-tRNA formyltransferase
VRWQIWHVGSDNERLAFEAPNHSPGVRIPFLNPYVIPAPLLAVAKGRAFNVHSALPTHLGRDPQYFAFYKGATSTGATLYRMSNAVEAGAIIDVSEEPLNRSLGVMRFIEEAELLSIALLLKHLNGILEESVHPQTRRQSRSGAHTTRKQFLEMYGIDASMDAAEVLPRIESFFNPAFRSISMDVHGHRFVYEPEGDD